MLIDDCIDFVITDIDTKHSATCCRQHSNDDVESLAIYDNHTGKFAYIGKKIHYNIFEYYT